MTTLEELQRLRSLLDLEREAERKTFEELLLQTPLAKRVEKGATWYPLDIEKQGWSLGDHPYVIVSRTKMLGKPHKFRSGQVVSFFSAQPNTADNRPKAVVDWIRKDTMRIIFYGNRLPEWFNQGQVGMDIDFDERSFQQMDAALEGVIEAKDNRLAELREILLGDDKARFDESLHPYSLPYLNESQNGALQSILAAKDVALVHGPPGTGKTTTLVHAIEQVAKQEKSILVCAPSNPAADLLTDRLVNQGLNVVRVGNISRVDDTLIGHTVEGILDKRPEMQEVKRLKIEAAELRRKGGKYKRNFGHKERAERREAFREAKSMVQHARMLEDYTIEKILSEADVITTTLVSSMSRYIEKRRFQTLFIDEAAQALEPACWIPISKAQRVIFAGDPFQLPPTVKSREAQRKGLSITLLEKCIKRLPRVDLLKVQYRMNELIMGFSNTQFYDNQLIAADFVANRLLDISGKMAHPVEFIDTAGCGFEEKINPESLSRYNEDEYVILRQHLDALLTYTIKKQPRIGIISPYREQVRYIQENYESDFDHYPEAPVTIDTIDAFQGQERDAIYISLVRSNAKGEIGFLSDTRRMNVALTRAKVKLIVIGDSATLGNHSFYRDFISYCERINAYTSAWEWM